MRRERRGHPRVITRTGAGYTPVAILAGVSSGDVIQVILDPDDPVTTVTVA